MGKENHYKTTKENPPPWMKGLILRNVEKFMRQNGISSYTEAHRRMKEEDSMPAHQDQTGIGSN